MRITEDAIDAIDSEGLEKAVEDARKENRRTVRAEDIPE